MRYKTKKSWLKTKFEVVLWKQHTGLVEYKFYIKTKNVWVFLNVNVKTYTLSLYKNSRLIISQFKISCAKIVWNKNLLVFDPKLIATSSII